MTENDDLKQVYTGSFVEANYVKSLLEESGIGAIIRDTMKESLVAGWASGSATDSALVYVAEYHLEEAKKLVDEYLASK